MGEGSLALPVGLATVSPVSCASFGRRLLSCCSGPIGIWFLMCPIYFASPHYLFLTVI